MRSICMHAGLLATGFCKRRRVLGSDSPVGHQQKSTSVMDVLFCCQPRESNLAQNENGVETIDKAANRFGWGSEHSVCRWQTEIPRWVIIVVILGQTFWGIALAE